MIYNWQKTDWPDFKYDVAHFQDILFAIAEKTGLINGKLSHLTKNLQTEAMIDLIVEEAINTSAIEGEFINRLDVRSSIKNKLHINHKIIPVHDKRAQGIAELMLDVRHTFKQPLTKATLFKWHCMLLSGHQHSKLKIAGWRTHKEPMQILSGYHGKMVIHFEAPPSHAVPKEMNKYIAWFNDSAPGQPNAIKSPPIRAAIAHLYFESIHPFEDGNGRIGRAIAEKALSQGFGYPAILSLSHTIEANKKAYYEALNQASRANEITAWIHYFVNVIFNAQIEVETQINFILKKSAFFDKYKNFLNERQLKVIQRMMKAGVKGFVGGMTAKKYMTITGTSKPTATRDLQNLVEINAFIRIGSGRSIRYELNM